VGCPLIGPRSNIQTFKFSLGFERASAKLRLQLETRPFVWPSTSTCGIMMALNRQHVGTAVYSVLRWLQCRPIRAGPVGLRRAITV
jgi:hypothetical protein